MSGVARAAAGAGEVAGPEAVAAAVAGTEAAAVADTEAEAPGMADTEAGSAGGGGGRRNGNGGGGGGGGSESPEGEDEDEIVREFLNFERDEQEEDVRMHVDGEADDEDEGGDGDREASRRRKGKDRVPLSPPRRSNPPRDPQFSVSTRAQVSLTLHNLFSQTFATQSQVSHMSRDLHELNSNMSRLVTLVDQQTQFFSTLQNRGFFSASPRGPSSGGAAPQRDGGEPMDVDDPLFAPIPSRPRRGRTHEPKRKGLPTARDADDVALAVRVCFRPHILC